MVVAAGAEPAVELREVVVEYPTKGGVVRALDSVTMDVPAGGFLSLVGASGCGKSTLLRTIAGLISPASGTVRVLGSTPAAARGHKLIGFAPQSPALMPWHTVLENVALPQRINRRQAQARKARQSDPERLVQLVGLGDAADRYPRELSGGMAQRVAIARALATGPELLLMDEPFSALDELTREDLRNVVTAAWQASRATVVWVTHSVDEAVHLSDRIVVMAGGHAGGRLVGSVDVAAERPRDTAGARAEMLEAAQRVRELLAEVRR